MKRLTSIILSAALGLLLLTGAVAANGQSLITITNAFTVQLDLQSTNWVAIPYVLYDVETKDVGGGGALLYSVTPNFWAGVRAEWAGSRQTSAGVQAQLQVPVKVLGLKVIPFAETSVGLGEDTMYASGGAGGVIMFYSKRWKSAALDIGAAACYEHYVNGDASGNQILGGPLLHLSF